jgi:hypothetical protein
MANKMANRLVQKSNAKLPMLVTPVGNGDAGKSLRVFKQGVTKVCHQNTVEADRDVDISPRPYIAQ